MPNRTQKPPTRLCPVGGYTVCVCYRVGLIYSDFLWYNIKKSQPDSVFGYYIDETTCCTSKRKWCEHIDRKRNSYVDFQKGNDSQDIRFLHNKTEYG